LFPSTNSQLGGESRWVKLDPIKKIPEPMGSSLPTAIEFNRNGPAAFPLTVWASSRLLALVYINQNQIGLFLYHSKLKIFACLPSTSPKEKPTIIYQEITANHEFIHPGTWNLVMNHYRNPGHLKAHCIHVSRA
jgi:hypothetical protein